MRGLAVRCKGGLIDKDSPVTRTCNLRRKGEVYYRVCWIGLFDL